MAVHPFQMPGTVGLCVCACACVWKYKTFQKGPVSDKSNVIGLGAYKLCELSAFYIIHIYYTTKLR